MLDDDPKFTKETVFASPSKTVPRFSPKYQDGSRYGSKLCRRGINSAARGTTP